jgi:predicted lysophospholipase L1 biosynthesis ABC-type transport system permease subunit
MLEWRLDRPVQKVLSGAALGWLLALTATGALATWFHIATGLAPDLVVLLFTSIVSVLIATMFALAPLRTVTHAPATAALRVWTSTGYRNSRTGAAALSLQIALCFTLLTASGLLLRTLLNYQHTRLGMHA